MLLGVCSVYLLVLAISGGIVAMGMSASVTISHDPHG